MTDGNIWTLVLEQLRPELDAEGLPRIHRLLERSSGRGPVLLLRGAEERLIPILMTALTTGLALIPLIINGAEPGNEIEFPLAVVILGGLLTSTLLNLALVPALYLLLGRGAASPEMR